jgi:hypothetical protein
MAGQAGPRGCFFIDQNTNSDNPENPVKRLASIA